MEICCQPKRLLRVAEYQAHYEAYSPDTDLIKELKKIIEPTTVLLVFGYWCHDSERIVPEIVKALEVADNSQIQMLAVHVTYNETDPSPFMAGPIPVKRYPTVAFLSGHFKTLDEIPADTTPWLIFAEHSLTAANFSKW